MKLYVYPMNPVDFGWENFRTVEETLARLCDDIKKVMTERENYYSHVFSGPIEELDAFVSLYNMSLIAARKAGWEGDMREDAVVVPIIEDPECSYGFMWKQDNNGTTFVILPREDMRLNKACAYDHRVIDL